jgi:hypothetical protein
MGAWRSVTGCTAEAIAIARPRHRLCVGSARGSIESAAAVPHLPLRQRKSRHAKRETTNFRPQLAWRDDAGTRYCEIGWAAIRERLRAWHSPRKERGVIPLYRPGRQDDRRPKYTLPHPGAGYPTRLNGCLDLLQPERPSAGNRP